VAQEQRWKRQLYTRKVAIVIDLPSESII